MYEKNVLCYRKKGFSCCFCITEEKLANLYTIFEKNCNYISCKTISSSVFFKFKMIHSNLLLIMSEVIYKNINELL